MNSNQLEKVVNDIYARHKIAISKDDPAFISAELTHSIMRIESDEMNLTLTNHADKLVEKFDTGSHIFIDSANQATSIFNAKVKELQASVLSINTTPQSAASNNQSSISYDLKKDYFTVIGIFAMGSVFGVVLAIAFHLLTS